jgi:hypothetical protein
MKALLVGSVVGLVIGFVVTWRVHRQRSRESPYVTPAWINEHVYTRNGDDRQSK